MRKLLAYLALAAIYSALCRFALAFSGLSQGIAVLWPAAGFGFAVCWRYGARVLPVLWLGAVAGDLLTGAPSPVTPLLSLADMLGIFVSVELCRRLQGPGRLFATARGALVFSGAAILLGFLASCLGVSLLLTLQDLPPGQIAVNWWAWLLSDTAGTLLMGPFFLAWMEAGWPPRLDRRQTLEMAALIAVLSVLAWMVISEALHGVAAEYPTPYLLLPVLAWAIFRLDHRALVTFLFLCVALAVVGTMLGHGPFAAHPFPHSLLLLQAYVTIVAATSLVAHAVAAERQETVRTLQLTQDMVVHTLASMAEARDHETGAHILRTSGYVRILAEELKGHIRFRETLTREYIDLLAKAAPLHDIGKVGVPDAILHKPGPLTEREFYEIRKHPTYGCDILREAVRRMGDAPFIQVTRDLVATHHERWDGTGYPEGLAEEDIPVAGRLMALADVYDALISPRVYKKPMSHEAAREIILQGRGAQFDPDVVDAFLRNEDRFVRVSQTFTDHDNLHMTEYF
ncbi:MAG: HD domain-containing phosphohydrolase [Desulfovibrionaceae bacterium]